MGEVVRIGSALDGLEKNILELVEFLCSDGSVSGRMSPSIGIRREEIGERRSGRGDRGQTPNYFDNLLAEIEVFGRHFVEEKIEETRFVEGRL